MSDKLTVNEISIVDYQADITSGQHRKNYANIRNKHNALCDSLSASTIGTTNAETTAARPYHNSLGDKLDTMCGNINTVYNGGDVLQQAVPDMTVKIQAFECNVGGIAISRGYGTWERVTTTATITEYNHGFSNGDKTYVDVTTSASAIADSTEYTIANVTTNTFDITCLDAGDTSGSIEFSRYTGTITAPVGGTRTDIVTINSDATITVVTGTVNTSSLGVDPYPAISETQRPLATLELTTSTTSIGTGAISDIKSQGVIADRKDWYFDIQSAIEADHNLIEVLDGTYPEEVDLSGYSDIDLRLSSGTVIARLADTDYAIKCVNSFGNEETGIKISGGQLIGNNKAGAIELIKIAYTDNSSLSNINLDGNSFATATYKNMTIDNCDNIHINNLQLLTSDVYDSTSYNITNTTNTDVLLNDLVVENDLSVNNNLSVSNTIEVNDLPQGTYKKLTGVISAGTPYTSVIAHGLTDRTKVIMANGWLNDTTTSVRWIIPSGVSNIYIDDTNVTVQTVGTFYASQTVEIWLYHTDV